MSTEAGATPCEDANAACTPRAVSMARVKSDVTRNMGIPSVVHKRANVAPAATAVDKENPKS